MGSDIWPDGSSGYDQTFVIDGTANPATNLITFTGLNGDVDQVYEYDAYIVWGGNADVNVSINPNGLTTNKGMRALLWLPSVWSQFGFADWLLAENPTNAATNGGYTIARGTIYAKSGKARSLANAISDNFSTAAGVEFAHYMFNGWWKDTITNLTSLQFSHPTASGFGVGTRIRVRKL